MSMHNSTAHDEDAVEEVVPGSIETDPIKKKLPLPLKLFGVICIVSSAAFVPLLVLVLVGTALLVQQGQLTEGLSTTALVFFVIEATLTAVLAGMFAVLGVRLLRDKRRHAAHLAEVMIVLVILIALCDMMLNGLSPDLVQLGITLVLLIALASYVDPTLAEERELQRKLRDMETARRRRGRHARSRRDGQGVHRAQLLQPLLDLRRLLRAGPRHRDRLPLRRRRPGPLPEPRRAPLRAVLANLRVRRRAHDRGAQPLPRQERRPHFPGQRRHRRRVRVPYQLVHAVRLRHRRLGLHGHVPVHRRAHERHVHGHVGRARRGVDQASPALDAQAGEPHTLGTGATRSRRYAQRS